MQKQFNTIKIQTKERWFRFANTSLDNALKDVYRFYADDDILQINCW